MGSLHDWIGAALLVFGFGGVLYVLGNGKLLGWLSDKLNGKKDE